MCDRLSEDTANKGMRTHPYAKVCSLLKTKAVYRTFAHMDLFGERRVVSPTIADPL
jgi:hypothetical protein